MNWHIISDVEGLREFFKYAANHPSPYVVYDVETDGVNERKANLYGIGIAFDKEEAFYIPIRNKDTTEVFSPAIFRKIGESLYKIAQKKKLIGHNVIYDVLVLEYAFGYDFSELIYSDTILLKHMVDEERPFKLKEVAVKYLGPWADKAQQALKENIIKNGGKTTKEEMEMFKADTEVLAEYCCFDVHLTYSLYEMFAKRLKDEGLEKLFYEEEVIPLYKEVVIPMKRNGFPVDVQYFNNLQSDISQEIVSLESRIYEAISEHIEEFETNKLNDTYPVKRAGNFPKKYAEICGIELPRNKEGNVTLAKKELLKLPESDFKTWLLGDDTFVLNPKLVVQTQRALHGDERVFNIGSNDHLAWLFYDKLGIPVVERTETGKPAMDAEIIDELAGEHPFCDLIIEYRKLNKLKSTYIEGILSQHVDGIIYPSFLMHGTTSGRFSCVNPNFQNLPATKEDDDKKLTPLVIKYTNAIRKGLVSLPGYKIVDTDHEALEPRCFAHMSGDPNLQAVFAKGEDIYSSIAKRVFGVQDASVFKKDPDFLGTKYPHLRKIIKTLALAVTYGATAYRISFLLKKSPDECQKIIDQYLNAYPGLKSYIRSRHEETLKWGKVQTIYGRVRHLPAAKQIYDTYGKQIMDIRWAKQNGLSEVRKNLKNQLNNSTNFPIQGLAAHVVNRGSIEIMRQFKRHNINGFVGLQIHDQITCLVSDEDAPRSVPIIKKAMENVVKLSVNFRADPKIATNFKDSK